MSAAAVVAAGTQEAEPLAEPGRFAVGVILTEYRDPARDDRGLPVAIWYPARAPNEGGSEFVSAWRDAVPEDRGAPFPLIVSSPALGSDYRDTDSLLAHLASHGFLVASVDHGCDALPTCNLDRPLDVELAVERLADDPPAVLSGIVDAQNSGVMGISFEGYTALTAAGGEIDPVYYFSWASGLTPGSVPSLTWTNAQRTLRAWADFTEYASAIGVVRAEDRWVFPTDERIKAVLASSPALGWLFGTSGLSTIDLRTMVFAGTRDDNLPYETYAVPLYSQIGAADRILITFVDGPHHLELVASGERHFKHLSTAFFGYYLQGRQSYSKYLTPAHVDRSDDLSFGVWTDQ